MGILDYEWDDVFSGGDGEYDLEDASSEVFFEDPESTFWDDEEITSDFWDWGDDEESDFGLKNFWSDEEEDQYQMDEWEKSLDSAEGEEGSWVGGMLGKIPGSAWSKLLDFGVGGLAEWLKQKSAKTPAKRSGGGGGGRVAPVTAVKSANAIGTRT